MAHGPQPPPHLIPGAPPSSRPSAPLTWPAVEPIDRELLHALPTLPLRARYLAEGLMSGRHRSPLHGFSAEFAEHRQYQPGDELRRLDWRLYGRCDRLFVKEFEEETQLQLMLVLDPSGSMAYASRDTVPTKLDAARTLLAALGWIAWRSRDRFGCAIARNELEHYLPPGGTRGHLESMFERFDAVAPGGGGSLTRSMSELAPLLRKRTIVVIATDLYDAADSLRNALRELAWNRHEAWIFHIVDPMEMDFDQDQAGLFSDLETGEQMALTSQEVREAYLERFQAFLQASEAAVREAGAAYLRLRTDEDWTAALSGWLRTSFAARPGPSRRPLP